ncbi:MAG: hypothetical protein ACO27N_10065 [Bacteroidia bacterium]
MDKKQNLLKKHIGSDVRVMIYSVSQGGVMKGMQIGKLVRVAGALAFIDYNGRIVKTSVYSVFVL